MLSGKLPELIVHLTAPQPPAGLCELPDVRLADLTVGERRRSDRDRLTITARHSGPKTAREREAAAVRGAGYALANGAGQRDVAPSIVPPPPGTTDCERLKLTPDCAGLKSRFGAIGCFRPRGVVWSLYRVCVTRLAATEYHRRSRRVLSCLRCAMMVKRQTALKCNVSVRSSAQSPARSFVWKFLSNVLLTLISIPRLAVLLDYYLARQYPISVKGA